MPTKNEIEKSIKELLVRYNAEYALLFGSYARESRRKIPILTCSFSAEKILKSQIYLHLPKNLGE